MRLKEKLQKQIRVLESELEAIDKAIHLLAREKGSAGPGGHSDAKFKKLGLSDACRQIVGSEWILPSEVRNQMMQGGYKSETVSAGAKIPI